MNVWGKWGPLISALGSLAGLLLFGRHARRMWKERKRRQALARRPPRHDD
jgi:hypothetical protein